MRTFVEPLDDEEGVRGDINLFMVRSREEWERESKWNEGEKQKRNKEGGAASMKH